MKNNTRKRKRKNKLRKRSKKYHFIGGSGDEKGVYANLGGGTGLGNQLFIYAAGIVVKNRTGLPLYLIRGKNNPHSSTDYTIFFKEGTGVDQTTADLKIKNAIKLHEGQNVYTKWSNTDIPLNKSNDIFLLGGFYQNYASIHSALPFIRKHLLEQFNTNYPNFKDKIVQNKTACMHVRRGDYVMHGRSSTVDYFNKALAILDTNKEVDTLYIVSDDIGWSKQQKWITTKKIIYFDEPGADEIKTLYLMMLCKGGFILSESTYSSWGAMLGADDNPQSTIVYPIGWGVQLMFPSRWKGI